MTFETRQLPARADALAPDGSEVRILLARPGGSMAHFRLSPGQTAAAVRHRTVDEIWYVLDGDGELWRRDGHQEQIQTLTPDLCVTIPAGTAFQFRAGPGAPLNVLGITMPPWPGPEEADLVDGPWP